MGVRGPASTAEAPSHLGPIVSCKQVLAGLIHLTSGTLSWEESSCPPSPHGSPEASA